MSSRWIGFVVWALVAASAVAWGLRLFVRPAAVPAGAQVADTSPPLQADLTRLLGADPPPPAAPAEEAAPPADARFALVGVVAPRTGRAAGSTREGVALIAIDGQPPRAYKVGARVDGETVLQSVNARGAELGPRGGPAQVALSLPPPAPAATGSLPPAMGQPIPGVMPPQRAPAPVPPFARPGARAGAGPYPLQAPHQGTPAEDPTQQGQPEAPPAQRKPNPALM